jgi:preprotein translocase subunit YajC
MKLSTILLEAQTGAAQGGGFDYQFILMLVAFFVIIYFFMIRPQQKRQKDLQKARDAIKSGDKIVTSGGIYGKVREINDKYMLVEISENVKIRVDKGHIFPAAEEEKK